MSFLLSVGSSDSPGYVVLFARGELGSGEKARGRAGKAHGDRPLAPRPGPPAAVRRPGGGAFLMILATCL